MNNEIMMETNIKSNVTLEERHRKDEDYRYVPSLVWMEMYLPRFESRYGEFNYSSDDISNKQKCEELLDYFGNICGVSKIEEIYKKGSHRGRR